MNSRGLGGFMRLGEAICASHFMIFALAALCRCKIGLLRHNTTLYFWRCAQGAGIRAAEHAAAEYFRGSASLAFIVRRLP